MGNQFIVSTFFLEMYVPFSLTVDRNGRIYSVKFEFCFSNFLERLGYHGEQP